MARKWADFRQSFVFLITGIVLGRLSKRAPRSYRLDESDTLGAGGRATVEALRIAEEYRKRGRAKLSK